MKCQRCGKNKSQTFRREGGLAESSKGLWQELKKWDAVCLPCIKKSMGDKRHIFWEGPIITNPTIMPSGTPTEWVINE